LGTSKTGASIQPHAVPTCTTINLDLSHIGLEVCSRIFCGNSALDRKPSLRNGLLGQAQLRQGGPGSDLNLSSHDIDAGDFLCEKTAKFSIEANAEELRTSDGVFDLNPWVDLNEIVTAHLVHQELCSSGIPVTYTLCKLDGIRRMLCLTSSGRCVAGATSTTFWCLL
jgi:hypothetical protein